tara:strand:+ start:210 stop:1094 length:885 start_codon:yes stop_codon:yes gene_type:complete
MSIGKQDLQELAQGLGEYQQKYAIDLARTEAMMGDPSRLNALMQMQQPARPKGPAAFEEFLLARQYPEFGEFLQAKRKAGATKIDFGEKGFQELGAKKYENRLDLAMSAQASNINLDNLENILNQGLRTGFGASLGLQLNRIGQTLLGPDFKAGNIAGAESFAAGATQLILPEVKKLGVNPTDKDLDFVVKGSPELGKSVEGNKLMLKALRLSNLRAIDSHNFDNAFYSNPENEGKTEIDRNVAFQTHMLNNPQLYNAQSLIEEYNSLLEREAANKLNQGDFVDTSNEELPEGM